MMQRHRFDPARAIFSAPIGRAFLLTVALACGDESSTATIASEDVSSDVTGDATGTGDTTVTTCDANSECPAGPCQVGVCDGGFCTVAPAALGAACDDDDACSDGDRCVEPAPGASAEDLVCEPVTPGCSDGNACNGTESCGAAGCVAGTALSCADGNACNGPETCDPAKGCVPGAPLSCEDDSNVCNGSESCQAASGCLSVGALNCDDGKACTTDSCDATLGCQHVLDLAVPCCNTNADCDDGNACTSEACGNDGKCTSASNDGGACQLGSACGGAGVCADGVCDADIEADCSVLCVLAGNAGDVVRCELGLARSDSEEAAATTLAFALAWPNADAAFAGFEDRVCFPGGGPCTTVLLPDAGSAVDPSGHTIIAAPPQPADWAGQGTVELAHLGDPNRPITTAFVEDEQVAGDAEVTTFRFVLTKDTLAAPVHLKALEAYTAVGVALTSKLVGHVVLTGEVPCSETLCADLNPCTTDSCDAGTCSNEATDGSCDDQNPCTSSDACESGQCVGGDFAAELVACPVDDACTSAGACDGAGHCDISTKPPPACSDESQCVGSACDPATGECQPSAKVGLDCNDDDSCSEDDRCSGAAVCAGVPVGCDDGIACTLDACEPTTGCAITPDDSECDDGVACSTGTCVTGQGCKQSAATGACDDGDPCTMNDQCSPIGCNGAPDVVTCGCEDDGDCITKDDGDACTGMLVCNNGTCKLDPTTVVVCPPDGYQCEVDWTCSPLTGTCDGVTQACDDDIDCTLDSCSPNEGCLHDAPVGCVVGTVCELAGDATDEIDCFVQVASRTGSLQPTGFDVVLQWKATEAQLIDVVDAACFGAICFDYSLAECDENGAACVWGSLEPAHHQVIGIPKHKKDWTTKLALTVYHPSMPSTPLTGAVVDSGDSVSGDPLLLKARFKLASGFTPASPFRVGVSDVSLNPPNGLELSWELLSLGSGRGFVTEVK